MNDVTKVLLRLTKEGNVEKIKKLIANSNSGGRIDKTLEIFSDSQTKKSDSTTKKEEVRQILVEAFKNGNAELINVIVEFISNVENVDLLYTDPFQNPLILAIAELPKLEDEIKKEKALELLVKYVKYDIFNISLSETKNLPSMFIGNNGDVTPNLVRPTDIISFSLLHFLCDKKFLPDVKDLKWIQLLIEHGANPLNVQLAHANGEKLNGSLDSYITQSLSRIAKLHNDNEKLSDDRLKYSVIIEWTLNTSFAETEYKKRYDDITKAVTNLKNVLKTSIFLQKACIKSTSFIYKDLKEFSCNLSNALAQDSFLVMKFLKNMTTEAVQQSLQKTPWATKDYQFILPMIEYINNIFNKISDKNNPDVQMFNDIIILLNNYNIRSELKIPLLFKNNEERDKFFDNHKPMIEIKEKKSKQSEIKDETKEIAGENVSTTKLMDTFGVIGEQRKEEKPKPNNDPFVRNNVTTLDQ